MTLYGIIPILKKEFREIWRDPYTLGIAVILPLILLFLFAYSLNLDVKNIPLAVVDLDQTAESRAYTQALVNSGRFVLVYRPASPAEAERLLAQGRAQVVLIIPGGFARALRRGDVAQVQTLVDGTFPTSARVVRGYVDAVNDIFSARLVKQRVALWEQSGRLPTSPAVTVVPQVRYNPAMRSANFIVPGLIAVLLMAFPPLLSALAIVREKEHGSIQQIFVSPLRSWAFIVGKMLPYLLIAFAELALLFWATLFWFQVPMRGSWFLFLLASIPYAVGTIAIGLLVSTLTRTQLAAMLLALVLTMMPSFLFSGFMFPIFTMPMVMQVYSYLFPARYYTKITYDIFLKGVGPDVWGSQLAILTLYTLGILILASLRFRKKVG